ncbi:hypothetical protein BHE74_00027336 [Ensete ventricosum]|nr:hypothetical protein BHE74_00027336 [Ensete ventricosum]
MSLYLTQCRPTHHNSKLKTLKATSSNTNPLIKAPGLSNIVPLIQSRTPLTLRVKQLAVTGCMGIKRKQGDRSTSESLVTVLSGGEAEKVRRLLSRVEAVNRAGAIINAAEIMIAAEEGGILIAGNH